MPPSRVKPDVEQIEKIVALAGCLAATPSRLHFRNVSEQSPTAARDPCFAALSSAPPEFRQTVYVDIAAAQDYRRRLARRFQFADQSAASATAPPGSTTSFRFLNAKRIADRTSSSLTVNTPASKSLIDRKGQFTRHRRLQRVANRPRRVVDTQSFRLPERTAQCRQNRTVRLRRHSCLASGT